MSGQEMPGRRRSTDAAAAGADAVRLWCRRATGDNFVSSFIAARR